MTLTWLINPQEIQELESQLMKMREFEGWKRESTKTEMMLMVVQNYWRLQQDIESLQNRLTRVQELAEGALNEPEFNKEILQSLIHATRGSH